VFEQCDAGGGYENPDIFMC